MRSFQGQVKVILKLRTTEIVFCIPFGKMVWVPEGSLAVSFGCHEMALELVRGADFSCILMCGPGRGDLRGSSGAGFGRKSLENRAEHFQPDCLQVPSGSTRSTRGAAGTARRTPPLWRTLGAGRGRTSQGNQGTDASPTAAKHPGSPQKKQTESTQDCKNKDQNGEGYL